MGLFIAFEGLDGAGTTTQARLLADRLEEDGLTVHLTKEPSEGPVGSLISLVLKRRLVSPRVGRPLDPFPDDLLALLFAADRIDHLQAEILPKLHEGIVVISDRYLLSSYAYQSLGCDLSWLREINQRAGLPDITFLIDVPAPVCLRRIEKERWQTELFEGIEKLSVVRKNYLRLATSRFGEAMNIRTVDGEREISAVHREICKLVNQSSVLDGQGAEPASTGSDTHFRLSSARPPDTRGPGLPFEEEDS